MYKAIAMATDKGIITPETRWNEGITKAEALEIVVNAFNAYYEDNGYLVNNADKGSLQALEEQALELWNKQDKNDMSCTEEEFINDYITIVGGSSATAEEFEESIERAYSISYAEELEESEHQHYIDGLWAIYGGEERVTCDKETFTKEHKTYFKEQGDSYTDEAFGEFIQNKYPVTVETEPATPSGNNGSGNNNNSDSGSSSNNDGGSSNNGGGSSGGNDTPTYIPPADNGGSSTGGDSSGGNDTSVDNGSSNNTGGSTVVDELPEGFFDMPEDLGDWGDQSDWESWE